MAKRSARRATHRTQYNGIRLPAAWPPRRKRFTRVPMAVPYLRRPPGVALIDTGRQLFVDDFLIERTTLRRTFHHARYHPACPVLTGDRPWESSGRSFWAAPYSDGVWFDPQDRKFKMWYQAGPFTYTCYAESHDGISWTKPKLDIVRGTNIVLSRMRDSSTVWLDHEERNPKRRYKMFQMTKRPPWLMTLRYSPDGVHWTRAIATAPPIGDRTTVFYNPFRKAWVFSLRVFPPSVGRARVYWEHPDAAAGLHWKDKDLVPWVGADRLDPQHTNPKYCHILPQLYNLDAVAYESLLLGLFAVWQGPENDESRRVGNHKRNEILLGFSRDGFHWHRPDRTPFIGVNETDHAWNWGNIQSAGGGCLVVGDKLYFYVSARALDATGAQGNMATGLAILRRDGFASMDAGRRGGTVTTRPVRFGGRRLFVNVSARKGELRAEVLDRRGKVIHPFTRRNCRPVKGDSTRAAVRWHGAADLAGLAGRAVRLRFCLTNARLYAFWVSPNESGASGGYIAAGGPGLVGDRDISGGKAHGR